MDLERGTAWAADLVARDQAVLWHPYAPMPATMPAVPVVAAHGVMLELADGRSAIDGMSSWWAAVHGYRHPVLDAAVTAQLGRMAHVMFGGLTHPGAIELAERLVAIAPPGLEHVFFADSGSVAVEVASKMALQYWRGRGVEGRERIVSFRSAYHGDTFGAMALCDPETGMHRMFGSALAPHLFAPEPSPAFGEPFDASHLAPVAALLTQHQHSVAAVIIEPVVQGAGGMRFYAPAFLAALRTLCDEHDVLLIVDEIATGFGRTGERFGSDHASITPDIMCVGKALTGGYLTLAATLTTPEVSHHVSRAESGALMHGPTYMANPLAVAVANASLDLLDTGGWRADVARIEAALRTGLEPCRTRPGVTDVRVLGAIGVVELDEPVDMVTSQRTLLDHGVWLRPFGRLLYTMPPFITSDDEVATICRAMRAVVDEVAA